MTRLQIKTFVTSLLDDYEMDDDLFNTFLDVAQATREGARPWAALRTEDISQSVTASNTFETEKTLPSDFRKWYTRFPIVLTDGSGNPQQYLAEIPIHMKSAYKDDPSRFYANYRTGKFYLCGSFAQSFTARLYYIRRTTKISTADTQDWELDPNDEYSKILAFDVAVYWKKGIDYDVISNPQADSQAIAANALFRVMEEWDDDLAESALQGQTYGMGAPGGSGYSGESSGSLSNFN